MNHEGHEATRAEQQSIRCFRGYRLQQSDAMCFSAVLLVAHYTNISGLSDINPSCRMIFHTPVYAPLQAMSLWSLAS